MSQAAQQATVNLMLRAYAEATGAPMTSIVRHCIILGITWDLEKNKGVRDRYYAIHARLLKENNVIPIRWPK